MNRHIHVNLPDGPRELVIDANKADSLLSELLRDAGIPLNTRCGGRGICKGCHVDLKFGAVAMPDREIVHSPATVKSCQCRLAGDELMLDIGNQSRP